MDDATKRLLEDLDDLDGQYAGSHTGWLEASEQVAESPEGTEGRGAQPTVEESARLKQQLRELEKRLGEVEGVVLRHLNTPESIAHKW